MPRSSAFPAGEGEPPVTFSRLSERAYAFTAGNDPTSGVVVGDDGVLLVDAQPTPARALTLLQRLRDVTDKPVRWVVLTGYAATRTLGASLFEGAQVVCSEATREEIVERGAADLKLQVLRDPRLFADADSIPGLTHPTITFGDRLSLWLGKLRVDLLQPGRGPSKGGSVVWLPEERTLFAGDLVASTASPEGTSAHVRDWPETLQSVQALAPQAVLPGRGDPLLDESSVAQGFAATGDFLRALWAVVTAAPPGEIPLKQACEQARMALAPAFGERPDFAAALPVAVARALDEARGLDHPRLWTVERELELRRALES
ncbi:MAG: MBL fold metallo-hydrolase [Reyranellaceae bacterium]